MRAVKPAEMIHLSKREVSCVFIIQSVNAAFSSLGSLDNAAHDYSDPTHVQQKLQVVIQAILKEEKFKTASEKMVAASSGDAKKRLAAELDECLRRIKILRIEKSELERAYEALAHATDTSNATPESARGPAEISSRQQALATIQADIGKKESVLKGVLNMLAVVTSKETKESLLQERTELESELQDLKATLEELHTAHLSVDVSLVCQTAFVLIAHVLQKKSPSINSMSKKTPSKQIYDFNGHVFRVKSQTPSADCYHCGDSLFGTGQTLECSICHLLCHKFCYSLITENCQTHQQLRNARKWYLMANDEADRTRWIAGLDCVRANIKDEIREESPTPRPLESPLASPLTPSIDIDDVMRSANA